MNIHFCLMSYYPVPLDFLPLARGGGGFEDFFRTSTKEMDL
jgi:hypothetical protein